MKKHIYRAKSRGQSIPLIAVMLVVLFGFAALAMDVGNAYAEQREVTRATNAAALEGMGTVIQNGTGGDVMRRITASIRSNKIQVPEVGGEPQEGDMTLVVTFLDDAGIPLTKCISACSDAQYNAIRDKISYVKVDLQGQVDTYFARVLGQEQFPVNAVAHAQQGLCTDGLYPIGVDTSLLNTSTFRFNVPDRVYSDDVYRNLSQKRILLRDDSATGGFGLMRWQANANNFNNPTTLVTALSSSGAIKDGFVEAPWPLDAQGNSAVPLAKTDGYPLKPGVLNTNEWVAGAASSLMNNANVLAQIDLHIRNRTLVNLPIYDFVTKTSPDTVYHVQSVGKFLIVGRGVQAGQSYLDLVYLSQGAKCADLSTPVGVADKLTLTGDVSLYPHFAQFSELRDPPIQYIFVLDISGSMTWNFDGYGSINGVSVRCQGPSAVICPAYSPHLNVSERRIAIAYQTMDRFINGIRSKDQARIVTFHGANYQFYDPEHYSNQEALDTYSEVFPNNWSNDQTVLRDAVKTATRQNVSGSGQFIVEGATPSSIGLARALQIYSSSPTRDGSNQLYKRAVVFITDGIANVTRDGQFNLGCESIDCNNGYWESPVVQAKPITAMNTEAANLRALITTDAKGGGDIYAIALGSIGTEALVNVTTNDKLYPANNPTELDRALAAIQTEVINGLCTDGVSRTSPLSTISAGSLPDYTQAWNTAGLVSPEVGVVTLTSTTSGSIYTGKMVWSSSGAIRYTISDLPIGDYTMTYWMVYKADDGVSRRYDWAAPPSPGVLAASSQTVSLRPSTSSFVQEFPIVMDMAPSYDVCAVAP